MDSDGPRRSSRVSGKSIRQVKKQRRPTKRPVHRPAGKGSSGKVRSALLTGPKIRQRRVKERLYARRPTTLVNKSILSVCPVTMGTTSTGGQGKTTTGKGVARTKTRTGNVMGRVVGKSGTEKGRPGSKRRRKVKGPIYGNRPSTLSSRSIRSMCSTPTAPTWPEMVIKTRGEEPAQVPPQETLHLPRAEPQERPTASPNPEAVPFVPNRDNLEQQKQVAPVQPPEYFPRIQERPTGPTNHQAAAPEPDPDQDELTDPEPEPESEPGSEPRGPWNQFR